MATFGLYQGGVKEPHQTFDGDKLILTGDCVAIYTGGNIMAVARLAEGQTVKQVSK